MIRVGPAGWSYPDWEGVVYPRKKPKGFHPLRHLARYFDTLEINSSFYGTPSAKNAAHWAELVVGFKTDLSSGSDVVSHFRIQLERRRTAIVRQTRIDVRVEHERPGTRAIAKDPF